MSQHFVDRKDIRNSLLSMIQEPQDKSVVYILSAKTGYGKSAFFQNIIDYVKGQYICHKVSIPLGHNISLDEGFYFRNLAIQVTKNSNIYNYNSFHEFIKNTKNPIVRRLYHNQLEEGASEINPIIKVLSTISKQNNILDISTEYQYLHPEDSCYIYLLFMEYLLFCFNDQKKIIINISNIQKIDKLSLSKLLELLQRAKNIFLLLEYTSETESIEQAKIFESNFYLDEILVITKKLKKLDLENTCKVLNNLYPNNRLEESIYREIYFTIDGNIRQLSDIDDVYELSSENKNQRLVETNYTEQRLKNITDANKIQILCIIAAHLDSVQISIFKDFLNKKSYFIYINLSAILSGLCEENGFLEIRNNQILFVHDSIKELIFSIPRFEIKIALAYSWWIEYYEDMLKSYNDNLNYEKPIIIKRLCYFYSIYPPCASRILSLLPDIRKISLNCLNPEEAVSFLHLFFYYKDELHNDILLNQLNKFLLDLYYELGIYNKAYTAFCHTDFKQREIQILYEAIIQNRCQHCKEAIDIIEDGLIEFRENKHFQLCANLIKLISFASNNNYNSCEEVFRQLIAEKSYVKFVEYGFLLRNSEIVCTLRDSIPYLENSVKHFKKYHLPLYEAHSRISLLMNYSRIGEFTEAEKNLKVAKKILKNNSLERHILLNDEVAYHMCRGEFNINFQSDLKLAMCTAAYLFDKIVINKNLLIIYAKNKCWDEGQQVVEILLNMLEKETNRVNICFAYWDISYFYKYFDETLYELYYKKYLQLYNELSQKPMRKSILEKDVYHKPGMEFEIGFISYWHFPIPNEL